MPLPTVLQVLPLLQPYLGGQLESSYPTMLLCQVVNVIDPVTMRKRDAQQKLKIKSQAESRRTVKDCDIQVGDTVLVRQPEQEKLSTPYHPTPLTVPKKHPSISLPLLEGIGDWKLLAINVVNRGTCLSTVVEASVNLHRAICYV